MSTLFCKTSVRLPSFLGSVPTVMIITCEPADSSNEPPLILVPPICGKQCDMSKALTNAFLEFLLTNVTFEADFLIISKYADRDPMVPAPTTVILSFLGFIYSPPEYQLL